MKLKVDATALAKSVAIDLMKDFDPSQAEPVKDRDGNVKLVDGQPTYRVRAAVSERETDRELRDVSVKIKHLPSGKINRAFDVKLAGEADVTPYVTDAGRLGLSIVVDGFAEGGK